MSRGGLIASAGATLLGLALGAVAITAALAAGWDLALFVSSYLLTNLVTGVGFLLCGSLLVAFRPRNPVGAVLAVTGLGQLTSAVGAAVASYAVQEGWPEVAARFAITLAVSGWVFGLGGLFGLALLLFPDGRLPSRSPLWRAAAAAILLGVAAQLVVSVTNSTPTIPPFPPLVPVFAFGLRYPEWFTNVVGIPSTIGTLVAIAALVVRYVRGDERTRRQLLWLILAVGLMVVVNVQRWVTGNGPIILLLSSVLLPVAITIAILRHRLLDIRLVLNRAVLYGLAIAVVVAVYAALVALASRAVPDDADRSVAIVAAIVVALAFSPLRSMLERVVGRAFYGARADPATTATRIGAELHPGDDVASALEQLRGTLRLPWLELTVDGETVAAGAVERGEDEAPQASMPLSAGDAGLRIGLRAGERRLHDDDRRTLALTATPIALLVRAHRLGEELRDARTATVEAREHERAALHRELHDGLGPLLAGTAFRIDAARELMRDAPDASDALLAASAEEVRHALDEVRRVVYGLRPLELEEDGVWASLERRARGPARLPVELTLPAEPPALTPAMETAVYRIVGEALANAQRHSTGSGVRVRIVCDDVALKVAIEDDGHAAADWTPGVGIRSLRDRVDELGGSVQLGPMPSGWRVDVALPYSRASAR